MATIADNSGRIEKLDEKLDQAVREIHAELNALGKLVRMAREATNRDVPVNGGAIVLKAVLGICGVIIVGVFTFIVTQQWQHAESPGHAPTVLAVETIGENIREIKANVKSNFSEIQAIRIRQVETDKDLEMIARNVAEIRKLLEQRIEQ